MSDETERYRAISRVDGGAGVPAWLIWLAVAAALGVVEMVTLAFAAGLMAAAALITVVVAGAGADATAQSLTFALASFAGLGAAYALAQRRSGRGTPYRSGTAALANRPAYAVTQVDGSSGAVQIGGETWSARAFDDTLIIAAGTRVAIFEIEGATALVYPMEF